jgi:hypothetical protein
VTSERKVRRAGSAPPGAKTPASAGWLASRPAWLQHLAALLLLALLLGAVLPEIAWQGYVFNEPDYQAPAYFAAAGERSLAAGTYPHWNPYIFLGMPSFGSLMFAPHVFPLSDLLQALEALPGYPPLGWLLFFFLAAGYGVFLVLWSFGTGFWPAMLGGVAFMLAPHLISMGVFGHGGKLGTVAFLPYLLWAAWKLRSAHRAVFWTGVLGAFIGMQLLRGHPQISYYGLLMLGLMALCEIVAAARSPRRRAGLRPYLVGKAASLGLGFALGAVLILPVRAYAPESIRGASEGGATWEYATRWSLAPAELLTFWMPSSAGFGEATYVGRMPFTNFPNYLGQATLVLAAAAFVFLRGRALWFLGLLALLSLFTSFGSELPILYRVLYEWLPHFKSFRVPVMILVLFQLALAIAAGLGLAALLGIQPRGVDWRRRPTPGAARTLALCATAAALVCLLAAWPWADAVADRVAQSPRLQPQHQAEHAAVARTMVQHDAVRVGLVLAATAALVWLAATRRIPAQVAAAVLVAGLAFDLGAVDRRMVQPHKTWPGRQSRMARPHAVEIGDSEMARALAARHPDQIEPVRVMPFGTLAQSNHWMAFGISSIGGYQPTKMARVQALFDNERVLVSSRTAYVLGAQYLVCDTPLALGREPVYSGADGYAYALPLQPPRAFVTGRWRPTTREGCVGGLGDAGFDVVNEVLLESPPASPVDSAATGSARVTAFGANRVELEVQADAPALLVLRDAYHSGWQARVDGQRRPVQPADCVLRAVAVPAGTSRVEFEFHHPGLRTGLLLSVCAAAVLVLLLAAGVLQSRRRPAPIQGT